MKTLSRKFKTKLKEVIKNYVDEFERTEFRKNDPEQNTELNYSNGRVYYSNNNLADFLFYNGDCDDYEEFIEHFNKFKANNYQGDIGYSDWINDEIGKVQIEVNNIIVALHNSTTEEEKEALYEKLFYVFYGDNKGFYNDDSTELYTTEEVIDIVIEEMTKYPFMIEEFVKDYYDDTDYELNELIKLGKQHGLFVDLSYDVEKED